MRPSWFSRLPLLALVVAGMLVSCSLGPSESSPWTLAETPLNRDALALSTSVDEHLLAATDLRNQIVAVHGEHTLDNTLHPLNQLEMHLDAASNDCQLFESVHPDAAVREVAQVGSRRVSEFSTGLGLDLELYGALAALDVSGEDEGTRFAYEKIMRDYRRSGVDKSEEVRDQIRALDAELVELGQSFDLNIRSDVRTVTVDSADALAGLPADYVASHPARADGKIEVNTTYPDFQPVMTYSTNEPLRNELFMAYKNRAFPQNIDVLGQLLIKRLEYAQLLGYPGFVDYRTEVLMIGSGEAANDFINQVNAMARPVSQRDRARLLERKRRDDPAATDVPEWEAGLYRNLVRKESYDFDSQALRPYFEFTRVRQGIIDLASRLFGLRIVQVQGLALWHESVTAYDVFDGGDLLGRFYLDLHPRTDKYGHAACFPYRAGIEGQRLPQAVLVCNFPDPSKAPGGVALMEFGQVQTFFHEFGHLLHMLLAGRQEWMRNSGFSVEWDFVEAPSQMLEEFLLVPEVLQSFAVHHETGQKVPAELIEKLKASSSFGKGSDACQQMFYAAVSLQAHLADPAELDTTKLVTSLSETFSPYEPVPGTHMQCSFGHLNGYSCIYYTYMWSKVIAKDLFSRFEAEGVLNPAVARSYREQVLEPGGSKPADELVSDFLGRPRSFQAFQAWIEAN